MKWHQTFKIAAAFLLITWICGCQEDKKMISSTRYKIAVVNKKNLIIPQYLEEGERLFSEKKYDESLEFYKKVLILDPKNETAVNRIQEINRWLPVIEKNTELLQKKEEEVNLVKKAYVSEKQKASELESQKKTLADTVKRKEEENLSLQREKEVFKIIKDARDYAFRKKFRNAEDVLKGIFMKYPEQAERIEEVLLEIRKDEQDWLKVQEERIKEKKRLKELEKKAAEEKAAEEKAPAKEKTKIISSAPGEKKGQLQDIIDERYLFETLPGKLTHADKIDFLEEKSLIIYLQSLGKAYDWIADFYYHKDNNMTKALHFYEKIVKIFPGSEYDQSAKSNIEKINNYLKDFSQASDRDVRSETQDLSAAAKRLGEDEKILVKYMDNISEAYYWIAQYYTNKKMLEEAVFYLQQLQEDVPDSLYSDDALFEIAEIYFHQGKWETAMLKYYAVIDNYPKTDLYKEVNMRLAHIFRKQGRFPKALFIYNDLSEDPSVTKEMSSEIKMETAKTHIESGQYDDAFPLLKQILSIEPKSDFYDEAQFYTGYVFFKKGDYANARKIFEIIRDGYSFNPYRDDAVFAIAESYFKEAKPGSCIESVESAFMYYPEYIEADRFTVMMGDCYMDISRYDLAEKTYLKMIQTYPESVFIYKAYYGMGKALIELKKQDEAKKYFILLIKAFPQTDKAAFSRYELSRIYLEEKDYKLADRHLTLALKKVTEGLLKMQMIYYRSQALVGLEQNKEALALLDRSIDDYTVLTSDEAQEFSDEEKKEMKDFFYYLFLEKGKILYENSDFESSLSLYTEMLKDFPAGKENDWVMYRMAMTYEDLGQMAEAGKTYESLQSKYGGTYWGKQAAWRLKNIKWNKDYGEKAKEIGGRHERE